MTRRLLLTAILVAGALYLAVVYGAVGPVRISFRATPGPVVGA